MNPKVSIIIPNYNHERFLQQRLDSVFNQTYQDFEVILLDDASTDGSQALLKDYECHPKVSHLIFNETNYGSPFKQWQKGIRLAQGEYIWIAESDDYCELDFLECAVNCIEQGADICYSQTYDVDEEGNNFISRLAYTEEFMPNIWEQDFIMDGNVFNENYLLEKNVIPNASAVVFKRSIVKPNFFSEELLGMQMCGDWLFWMHLCTDHTIAFISEPLNYFRYHSTISRTHNTLEKRKLRLREEAIVRKNLYGTLGICNTQKEVLLYNTWFNMHGFFEGFTKSFYAIKLPQTSRKALFLKFMSLKLKKHLKF